jgi:hypothetical protein
MIANHKLIKYCLTSKGETPSYILTETYGGVSGVWGIETTNRPCPQNMELIGVTQSDVDVEKFDTILEVFETPEELGTYLSTFLEGELKTTYLETELTREDPENPGETITEVLITENKVPYDIQEEVNLIWSKYLQINN